MTSNAKWFNLDNIEMNKEEVEDEVLEAVEEVKKPESKPSIHMIRSLRKADRSFNRTCAKCLRRLPKATSFYRDTDEFCIECGRK